MAAEKEIDPEAGPWHLLAFEIRDHRRAAGLSQEGLAKEAHSSEGHVGNIETMFRKPLEDTVAAFDSATNARGRLVRLYRLAARTAPFPYLGYLGFEAAEQEAVRIRAYEPQTIPGLLQTRSYALALVGEIYVPIGEAETILHHRFRRQAILTRERPPAYWAILDEGALRRLMSTGADVAKEQLSHIMEMAQLPHVKVEVLPEEAGVHACMNGGFALLTLPGRGEIAYDEGAVGEGRVITEEEQVRFVDRRYDLLRSDTLSVQKSLDFLRDLLERL